ncbi:hypothetical protein BDV25DRAFT_160111 [Aspergillus avenaceus]|uniref:Vacuolar sorting protein Vps3844 C-terminal domain-containing protein n=1 Tax=Aspergillus avenaceus TaxID=36643 RepID=A0A5N6TMK6_ASPAV|nr:hypothetical protein BDV25DRAFT_160111 [Aspergillus avenaceus]
MRGFRVFLGLSLAIASRTRASDAHIFTFNPPTPWQYPQASVVSEDVAQRLLELRMNVPIASALGDLDQDTIELLNTYGGPPSNLFDVNAESKDVTKNLVIVDGVECDIGSIQYQNQGHLIIPQPSAKFLVHDSLRTLLRESAKDRSISENLYCAYDVENTNKIDDLATLTNCIPKNPVFNAKTYMIEKELHGLIRNVESWVNEQGLVAVRKISLKSLSEPERASSTAYELASFLRNMYDLSSENEEVTVVLLPRLRNESEQQLKRDGTPRGALGKPTYKSSSAATVTALQMQTLPVCFTSNSSCNEATNSCSGHGSCYKKSSSATDGTSGDCYACKCKETTVTKADGTVQKSRWGGSACQKRDVSSPFILIAGITLLVIVAVSAAIGMLYHIGQDELPGVISAGVGATRVQK